MGTIRIKVGELKAIIREELGKSSKPQPKLIKKGKYKVAERKTSNKGKRDNALKEASRKLIQKLTEDME